MTLIPKGQKVGRMGKNRFEDPKHLRFVRELPCCCCKKDGPSSAHHLRRVPKTGTGRKAGDHQTIPLCPGHHQNNKECVHKINETEFLARYSIDGPALAAGLFSVTGDFERALRIIGGENNS